MKILAIGDPHGDLKTVKKISLKGIDLILLTGDLGSANIMRKMAFANIERKKQGLPEIKYSSKQEKIAFMEAYDSSMKVVKYLARFAPVFTVYGNVEDSNPETRRASKKIGLKLPFLTNDLNEINGVRVINNRIAIFNGIKVGGLEYFHDVNWVQEFKPSDFKKRMKNAKKSTSKAKRVFRNFKDIDILLCHQPPYGFLDKVTAKFAPKHGKGKHAGSKAILEYIKRQQPKYVLCGHIHEGEGKAKIGNTEVYNLGVCGYTVVEF